MSIIYKFHKYTIKTKIVSLQYYEIKRSFDNKYHKWKNTILFNQICF